MHGHLGLFQNVNEFFVLLRLPRMTVIIENEMQAFALNIFMSANSTLSN